MSSAMLRGRCVGSVGGRLAHTSHKALNYVGPLEAAKGCKPQYSVPLCSIIVPNRFGGSDMSSPYLKRAMLENAIGVRRALAARQVHHSLGSLALILQSASDGLWLLVCS